MTALKTILFFLLVPAGVSAPGKSGSIAKIWIEM
jgi:hypothetical protein